MQSAITVAMVSEPIDELTLKLLSLDMQGQVLVLRSASLSMRVMSKFFETTELCDKTVSGSSR